MNGKDGHRLQISLSSCSQWYKMFYASLNWIIFNCGKLKWDIKPFLQAWPLHTVACLNMNANAESSPLATVTVSAVERAVSKTHLHNLATQFFFGQNMITLERDWFRLQLFELLNLAHMKTNEILSGQKHWWSSFTPVLHFINLQLIRNWVVKWYVSPLKTKHNFLGSCPST